MDMKMNFNGIEDEVKNTTKKALVECPPNVTKPLNTMPANTT